jgi:cell wall assembly regulator SMI1
MDPKDHIGKTYKIKKGIYTGFDATIKSIQTNPFVSIDAEILVAGKKVEAPFLKPEDLGIEIKVEFPKCPPNIVEIFVKNCKKDPKIKKIFNKGATKEELDAFSSEIKLKLPDAFYEFYKNFNGTVYTEYDSLAGDADYPLHQKSAALLKLKDIIEVKKYWDEHLENMKKNFDPNDKKGPYLYWFWNENFVPFQTSNQCLLVVDTVGIKTKNKFQLLSFGRTGVPSLCIEYESLNKYFQTQNKRLEEGVLLNESIYDITSGGIYNEINGIDISQIEIFPFDVLPDYDWNKIYHM